MHGHTRRRQSKRNKNGKMDKQCITKVVLLGTFSFSKSFVKRLTEMNDYHSSHEPPLPARVDSGIYRYDSKSIMPIFAPLLVLDFGNAKSPAVLSETHRLTSL